MCSLISQIGIGDGRQDEQLFSKFSHHQPFCCDARELDEDEAARPFAFTIAVKPGPLAHKGDKAAMKSAMKSYGRHQSPGV